MKKMIGIVALCVFGLAVATFAQAPCAAPAVEATVEAVAAPVEAAVEAAPEAPAVPAVE